MNERDRIIHGLSDSEILLWWNLFRSLPIQSRLFRVRLQKSRAAEACRICERRSAAAMNGDSLGYKWSKISRPVRFRGRAYKSQHEAGMQTGESWRVVSCDGVRISIEEYLNESACEVATVPIGAANPAGQRSTVITAGDLSTPTAGSFAGPTKAATAA